MTHYCGAPTVHIGVAGHPSAHRLERPVTVLAAGAPPSPTLIARLEELNFRVVHVYGLTETYGPITVSPEPDGFAELDAAGRARVLARQGQAYPTADLVRVVDADDADVPRDGATMGEVVMRGNNVMLGYLDDPEATAQAFRGGWFHSGDLAVWHPDGTIELRDRAKDVIISGGENISTIEVEQALASHPAVLECAVVAIPHERWGERPKAFVTLREGAEATRGGADRALPRAHRALQGARRASSSARCRRPRPARCRSSSCASASGATARRASTDRRVRPRCAAFSEQLEGPEPGHGADGEEDEAERRERGHTTQPRGFEQVEAAVTQVAL